MSLPADIGRYEIKSEIGRGGMAIVYRAYDPLFKRDVAIKVLPQYYLHEPGFGRRFAAEAQLVAQLEHVAIVPVYDFGGADDDPDAQPFLVMRFLQGGSLRDRLRREGALPLNEAYRILNHLAPGLDKAHSRGIIHRDLKPDNILFDEDNQPYLVDFGIARLTEATRTMTIIGTPSYMSPEQWEGVSDLDGRCDIYALGAILFEMLTGSSPFQADTPASLMRQHLLNPVPDSLQHRPDLPAAVQAIIERGMAKDRQHRFASAAALVDALRSALELVESVDAPPPPGEDGRETLVEGGGLATIGPDTAASDPSAPLIPPGVDTYDSQVVYEEARSAKQASLSVPEKTELLEYDAAHDSPPQASSLAPSSSPAAPASKTNVIPRWGWGLLGVVLLAALITRFALNNNVTSGSESGGQSPPAATAAVENSGEALLDGQTLTATPIPERETPPATPEEAAVTTTLEPTTVVAASDTYILYILNASNNMMVDDGLAFTIAREGLGGHMLALQTESDGQNVGLMAYGHLVNPVAGGCDRENVQLLVDMAAGGMGPINEAIPSLFAVGRAPLKEALRFAYQNFSFTAERKNAIILITNSGDGCDENPLETIRINQENAGQRLPIFIAGINVPAGEETVLREMAQLSSNGSYRDVGSTEELLAALADFVSQIE